jgi:hypothetical protein
MATKLFSLADLDVTKQSEAGFEFEVQDDSTGKGIGVHLTVIGAHAPAVQKFTSKKLNDRRAFDEMNERRGKKAQIRKIEDDVEFGIELAAIRIVGWRGISEEFSQANAIQLCTVNPTIREQILKASEDLANFTKAPAKS